MNGTLFFSLCTSLFLALSCGVGSAIIPIKDLLDDEVPQEPTIPMTNAWLRFGQSGLMQKSKDGLNWVRSGKGLGHARAMTYGGGRFVAMGGESISLISSTGQSWTQLSAPDMYVFGLTYGNGLYVAAASNEIGYSDNGKDWTVTSQSNGYIRYIAFGNGIFVGVGDDGKSIYSTDGVSWTTANNNNGTMSDIAFGNGVFVAVGTVSCSSNTTGANWTPRTGCQGQTIAYGNGRFVVAGSTGHIARYSDDGTTWTAGPSIGVSLHTLVYAEDRFVGCGSIKCAYSTDGTSWTLVPISTNTSSTYAMAYGNGVVTAINQIGESFYSTDRGVTWTVQRSNQPYLMSSIAYGNGVYVVTGGNYGPVYAMDAESWSHSNLDTLDTSYFYSTFGNGRFVIVGTNGASYYSDDGKTWTQSNHGNGSMRGVAYGNGVFVAVGDGTASYSLDGVTWTNAEVIVGDMNGVGFFNDRFVSIGTNGVSAAGYIRTSTDGRTWSLVASNVGTYLKRIAYGNGAYVVRSSVSGMYYSTNLTNWTSNGISSSYESNLFFADNRFLFSSSDFTLYQSTDGANWDAVSSVVGEADFLFYGSIPDF